VRATGACVRSEEDDVDDDDDDEAIFTFGIAMLPPWPYIPYEGHVLRCDTNAFVLTHFVSNEMCIDQKNTQH